MCSIPIESFILAVSNSQQKPYDLFGFVPLCVDVKSDCIWTTNKICHRSNCPLSSSPQINFGGRVCESLVNNWWSQKWSTAFCDNYYCVTTSESSPLLTQNMIKNKYTASITPKQLSCSQQMLRQTIVNNNKSSHISPKYVMICFNLEIVQTTERSKMAKTISWETQKHFFLPQPPMWSTGQTCDKREYPKRN